MAVRFDNMQMLFGKINNGSPFGVIRGFYDYFPNNPNNSPQLRQFLNNKCHFIGFVEIFIEPSESLFFVYENDPSTTFNLKNFLLVIISDALLSVVSCCFMDDKNLKDLKKLLSQVQINLSNAITMTINNANAFEFNEINLTSAIIDKIEYHFHDNTFHFIFDVSNKFLSGKLRLTIRII
ncbi:hypothetical protein VN1269_09760 [Helicobacter pylori]|nr:hypothetical protein VN1269_09760 [Helicobacter pylori]